MCVAGDGVDLESELIYPEGYTYTELRTLLVRNKKKQGVFTWGVDYWFPCDILTLGMVPLAIDNLKLTGHIERQSTSLA